MSPDQSAAPTIRAATPADVPAIVSFIRELAEFEHLAHEVVVEERQVSDALFGAAPVAEALIAEIDVAPVGFALFFRTFSTFLGRPGLYLEDLYVTPGYRRRGVGRALLARIVQIAQARGCGRLEWAVLNWNRRAIELYERLGAAPLSEWTTYRLSGESLSEAGR